MKIKALQALERLFGALATLFNWLREHCAVCAECGRNRYTGLPCYVVRQEHNCKES